MKSSKMLKRICAVLTAAIIPFSFISYSNSSNANNSNSKAPYEKITSKEAKELIDNEKEHL